jgi:hypothetical protein
MEVSGRMNAIRVYTRVTSDTLRLPHLKQMLGKDVEIIVLDVTRSTVTRDAARHRSLHGSVLRYDDPFGQAAGFENA